MWTHMGVRLALPTCAKAWYVSFTVRDVSLRQTGLAQTFLAQAPVLVVTCVPSIEV